MSIIAVRVTGFLILCALAVTGFVIFDCMDYDPSWDEPLQEDEDDNE